MLDRLDNGFGLVDQNFRQAMRQLTAGVSIVTAGNEAERGGFTATSVISLSVEPPRLLVAIDTRSRTWPLISNSGGYSVNLLAAGQEHLAHVFAGRTGVHGPDRFSDADWQWYPGAGLALAGAIATIHCALEEAMERHGHMLAIGQVLANTTTPGPALIYRNRTFHHVGDSLQQADV